MEITPGAVVLDRYVIESLLDEDKTGRRYRAHHATLSHAVTVKVGATEDEHESSERFKRAAALLAQIRHSNVVSILDYGTVDRAPCIVTEATPGETFRQRLQTRGAQPWPEAVKLMRGALRGLAAVHDGDILHRNLTPEHISVDRVGLVKLTDLGWAKSAKAGTPSLTGLHTFVGTPAYASPEQILQSELSVRSDIYSAGLILYELLTGQLPEGATPAMRDFFRRSDTPPPAPVAPDGLQPIVPHLQQLVLATLAPSPARRPQSARALAEVLKTLQLEHAGRFPTDRLAPLGSGVAVRDRAKLRLRQKSAWQALAARNRMRDEPSAPAPLPLNDDPTGPQAPARVAALQPDQRQHQGLMATWMPPHLLEDRNVARWLAGIVPSSGRCYHVSGTFWIVSVQALDPDSARAAIRDISTQLRQRFGVQIRVAARLVPVDFVLPAASLDGNAPPPIEVLELMEIVATSPTAG